MAHVFPDRFRGRMRPEQDEVPGWSQSGSPVFHADL